MNSSNTICPKRQSLWQNLPHPRRRQLLAILAQWTLRQRMALAPAQNPSTLTHVLPKGEQSHEPDPSQD